VFGGLESGVWGFGSGVGNLRVDSLGYGVWGRGLEFWGLGLRLVIWGMRFGVEGVGIRVQGYLFGAAAARLLPGLGLRVEG